MIRLFCPQPKRNEKSSTATDIGTTAFAGIILIVFTIPKQLYHCRARQVSTAKTGPKLPQGFYAKIDLLMKIAAAALTAACFFLSLQANLPAQDYDGIWFLGFNMKKELFSGNGGRSLRQAVNHAINRSYICKEMIGDDNVPTGIFPPGLPGRDPTIKGYSYSRERARNMIGASGKRLKTIVLLHTDGQKTVSVARAIKRDLSSAGIDISLRQISYEEDDTWERELSAGSAHMFLMGYKVPPQPFERNDPQSRSEKLLYELFHSKGEANMFFLKNQEIDAIIDMISATPSKEAALKERLMNKADRMLFYDPVTVNLFYIRELQ